MALAALANIAAATAAGYKETVLDRGASFSPAGVRFEVTLEGQQVGEPGGQSHVQLRAFGQGSSQANAETVALAALNNQRLHRYGADSGSVSKGNHLGQHVIDVT
jgi:hypothetical protein